MLASEYWGRTAPSHFRALRKKMAGRGATAEDKEAFGLLRERWQDRRLFLDPRLVGNWALEFADGEPVLTCEFELPKGYEAIVPPPLEERVAIGGQFLDEVRIPAGNGVVSLLPVEHHRGRVHRDGSVTIHTNPCVVIQLFTLGVLSASYHAPHDLFVGGERVTGMTLSSVECGRPLSSSEAILRFDPSAPGDAEVRISS